MSLSEILKKVASLKELKLYNKYKDDKIESNLTKIIDESLQYKQEFEKNIKIINNLDQIKNDILNKIIDNNDLKIYIIEELKKIKETDTQKELIDEIIDILSKK